MTRTVRFTRDAEEQSRVVDEWWQANREKAPLLFAEELRCVCDLLAQSPGIGQSYPSRSLPGVRRAFLARTRFHVYYVVRPEEIVVVAVWSALRGHGPPLGRRPSSPG
jgi:plasmid stabilization system protein ParE